MNTLPTRKWSRVIPALLLISLLFVVPSMAFSGSGSGTSGDPYQITTCSQLQEMNASLSSTYKLMNDINCYGYSGSSANHGWIPVGTQGITLNAFTGTLLGYDHKISGLAFNGSCGYNQASYDVGTGALGLFGQFQGRINRTVFIDVNLTPTTSGNCQGGTVFGWQTAGTSRMDNISVYGLTTEYSQIGQKTDTSARYGCIGGYTSSTVYLNDSVCLMDKIGIANNNMVGGILGRKEGNVYFKNVLVNVTTLTAGTGTEETLAAYQDPTTCTGCFKSPITYSHWVSSQMYTILVEGGVGTPLGISNSTSYSGWDFTSVWAIGSSTYKGNPIPQWLEAPASGTIDWTNAGPVLNQTSQGYSWTSSSLSSPYVAICPPTGSCANTSVAASGSSSYTVNQVGTWTNYIQDGNVPTAVYDSDTIVVDEVTDTGTFAWSIASGVSPLTDPYNWTYSGITGGKTLYINVSKPDSTWDNTTSVGPGASGGGNKVLTLAGSYTAYLMNLTHSLASGSATVSPTGSALWGTPSPTLNNTVKNYSWSESGLADPYICIQAPNSTWTNTSVAASGSGTVSINQRGVWWLILTDGDPGTGTVPNPTTAYDEVALRWNNGGSVTNQTTQGWTCDDFGTMVDPYMNLLMPNSTWLNTSCTASGSYYIDLLGSWVFYPTEGPGGHPADIIDWSGTLDTIVVSEVTDVGTVDWDDATIGIGTTEGYSWTFSGLLGSTHFINISNPSSVWYNSTITGASGSGSHLLDALGTWTIRIMNATQTLDSDTISVTATSAGTVDFTNPSAVNMTTQGYTWSSTAIVSPYIAIQQPSGTFLTNMSVAASGSSSTYINKTGTWTIYIQNQSIGEAVYDTDTILISEITDSGTIAVAGTGTQVNQSPVIYSGTINIVPRQFFINVSKPLGGWNNITKTAVSLPDIFGGSFNLTEPGTWNLNLMNETHVLATASVISTRSATGGWTNPTGYTGTSEPYTWSFSGVASPYVAIKKPSGTFFNSSVSATGSANYLLDQVGTWYIYLTDGAGGYELASDTLVASAPPTGYITITSPSATSLIFGVFANEISWSGVPAGYTTYSLYVVDSLNGHNYTALPTIPITAGAGSSSLSVFNFSITSASDFGAYALFRDIPYGTIIDGSATTALKFYGDSTLLSSTPVNVIWHGDIGDSVVISPSSPATPTTLTTDSKILDTTTLTWKINRSSISGTAFCDTTIGIYNETTEKKDYAIIALGYGGTNKLQTYSTTLLNFINAGGPTVDVSDYAFRKNFVVSHTLYTGVSSEAISYSCWIGDCDTNPARILYTDPALIGVQLWYMYNTNMDGFVRFTDATAKSKTSWSITDTPYVYMSAPAFWYKYGFSGAGSYFNVTIWQVEPGSGTPHQLYDGGQFTFSGYSDSHTYGAPFLFKIPVQFEDMPNRPSSMTPEGTYYAALYAVKPGPSAITGPQSSNVAVTKNFLDPIGWASSITGVFNLGSGMGGMIFGILIVFGFALVPMIIGIRDARVLIFTGGLGALLAYALGLFQIWVILAIVVIAAALLAVNFGGILTSPKSDGEESTSSGTERKGIFSRRGEGKKETKSVSSSGETSSGIER